MRFLSILIALCSVAISFGAQTCAQGLAARNSLEPPRVVFVCEHGSVKSLVAMEYFNRRVQTRGLAYRAVARGVAPEPAVPNPVREGLRGDGFDISAFEPRKFGRSDVDHASLIVSFDQDVARIVGTRVRYLKWDDLPAVLSDYTRGKDEIMRHVDALIDELARGALP
jgi:arsenate reductase (thioredoxin)